MTDSVLYRAEVVRSLERAAARRVTIVAAPEGFGKTTIVSALDRANCTPICIRPGSSFERFVHDLVCDVSPLARGMSRSMPTVYAQTLERPDGPADLAAWFCGFLTDIERTFVIDGADVDADPRIAQFLRAAIAESRQRALHWILVGSHPGRLRELTGPVGGPDAEIGLDQLVLTFPELRQLAMRLSPVHTSGDLLVIARKAAGSISRAVFLLRCLHFGVAGAADAAASFESLLEKCFTSLSERERLETMAGMLLERNGNVQGGKLASDISSVFSRLRTTAPHLFEVDGERFQACFRSRIESELRALIERNRTEVYIRAADALEANGHTASAIALYCAVDAVDRLLDVVERGRGFGLEGELVHALREALDLVPESVREQHGLVVGLRAVDASNRGRHAEATDLFERALVLCRPGDHEQSVRYWYAVLAVKIGDASLAKRLLRPSVAFFRTPPALRASMMALLGVSYAMLAEAERAARWVSRARIVSDAAADDALAARIYQQAAYVALRAGELDDAHALGSRAIEFAELCGWPHVAAITYSILHHIALEQDRHEEIGAFVRLLAVNAERSGNVGLHYYALAATYEYEVERCNLPAVAELGPQLDRFDVSCLPSARSGLRPEVPFQAMQLAWEGHFLDAFRLVEPFLDLFEKSEDISVCEPLTIAHAAIYAAGAGLVVEANRALRLCRAAGLRETRPRCVQRTRVCEALTLWLLGKDQESATALRGAIKSMTPGRTRLHVFAELVAWAVDPETQSTFGPALTALEEEMYGNGWGGLVRLMRSILAGGRIERRHHTGLNRAIG